MSDNKRFAKLFQHLKNNNEVWNQANMAKTIEISTSYMSQLMSGERDVSEQIANRVEEEFPNISGKWLLTGEGEMLKKRYEEGIIITNPNVMEVPLISKYAYAGYQNGYGDDEYLEQLPTYPFLIPNQGQPRGHYVSIEVKGDSMDDGSIESLTDGDILLCREVQRQHWSSKLHYKKWNFVIVTNGGIIVKRIVEHDTEKCTIKVHSLNEMYEDYTISLNDVRQLLNVVQVMRKPVL